MEFSGLTSKKGIFFFDSFGFTGFKEFIMNDDEKIINRLFCDLKKLNMRDNKLTLLTIKCSTE